MAYTTDFKTKKDILKLERAITDSKVKCKCGHTIVMPNADRTICRHCGHYIYRTEDIRKKYEFKTNLRKVIKENGK